MKHPARPRLAWGLTGSGHYLRECLDLARTLPDVDLYPSKAAAEVLHMYGFGMDGLRQHFRVFHDNTASAAPVGLFYHQHYHTVVVAPASSNTVAKCLFGISDTLVTQHLRAGREVPGSGDRFRLRHDAAARDRSAGRMGDRVPAADRSREHRAPRALPAGAGRGELRDPARSPRAAPARGRRPCARAGTRVDFAAVSQAKPEHILFLTGKLAEKSLARVLESMADVRLHLAGARARPERSRPDDGRDDRAPPAGCRWAPTASSCRGAAAAISTRSSRTPRRAGRARPRGAGGPAPVLRPARSRARSRALRHARLRRDRGRAHAHGRGDRGARPRACRRRRRRDRPRLPAGDAVSAPGGGDRRTCGRSASRSARTRSTPTSCCARAGPAPTTSSACARTRCGSPTRSPRRRS